MSEIFTSTVEKDDGHGFLKTDAIRLTEIGGGIAHTVTCREGALCVQHCNLIIEVEKLEEIKELGGLEDGTAQRRKVFDENGVSPTLQAAMGMGGGQVPMVVEKSSFPLRMVRTEEGKALRKEYEAGNIHHGFNEYREPECRTDGVSNTVTTVQKDTLLLEKEQVLAYDEQNQTIRTETFGTLTTDGSSPKHNNRVIKIKQATKQGFIECEIGGVFCSEYPTSELRRGRVIENGQISPTLTTESIPDRIELGNPDFYNFLYEIDGEIYLIRIRKLIPLECWRLMGFSDEDFYKAEEVNSNTQLYKQAGNSIVCTCLEAIFSQMNIKGVTPWNEKQESIYQGQ